MSPDLKTIEDIALELGVSPSLIENYGLYISLENQFSLAKTRIGSLYEASELLLIYSYKQVAPSGAII